jgi:hypothetical protein
MQYAVRMDSATMILSGFWGVSIDGVWIRFPYHLHSTNCSTITVIYYLGLVKQASSGLSTKWNHYHPTQYNNSLTELHTTNITHKVFSKKHACNYVTLRFTASLTDLLSTDNSTNWDTGWPPFYTNLLSSLQRMSYN